MVLHYLPLKSVRADIGGGDDADDPKVDFGSGWESLPTLSDLKNAVHYYPAPDRVVAIMDSVLSLMMQWFAGATFGRTLMRCVYVPFPQLCGNVALKWYISVVTKLCNTVMEMMTRVQLIEVREYGLIAIITARGIQCIML